MKIILLLLSICLGLPFNCIGQNPVNHSLQSSSVTFGSIEYSIGEIYVVEIESEKEPERQEDYLSVFAIPNPVNDRVQLVGTLELSGKELIIKDVFGRTVARIMMNENMSFVFPQMSSGIYFIVSSIQEFQPIRVIKE